ncbi:MAG: hypothetical protein QW767_05800 [Thermoprotei archaeon]
MTLQVTFLKLEKYTSENKFFQLIRKGSSVQLMFVPAFPEAEDHSGGESIRVCMYGHLKEGKFLIDRVETDSDGVVTPKSPEEAEYAYSAWLQFIEENY